MMSSSLSWQRMLVAMFFTGASLVKAQFPPACPNCLSVFSMQAFGYHGPDMLEAAVKIYPLPKRSECTTVVVGQWTAPDGTTIPVQGIASGVNRRATFLVNTAAQPIGTYKLDILDVKCGTGYIYSTNGNDSITVSLDGTLGGVTANGFVRDPPTPQIPITRAPTPAPTSIPTITPPPPNVIVAAITLLDKVDHVSATLRVIDTSGSQPLGVTVSAVWTLPDGTTSAIQTDMVDQWNMVMFRQPVNALYGTYKFTVLDMDVTFNAAGSIMEDTIVIAAPVV